MICFCFSYRATIPFAQEQKGKCIPIVLSLDSQKATSETGIQEQVVNLEGDPRKPLSGLGKCITAVEEVNAVGLSEQVTSESNWDSVPL